MIRVFVADDEAYSLRRLLFSLKDMADLEVVGHAGNGKLALSEIHRLRPDLAILDIEMPGLDGLKLASVLGISGPKVIFVTAFAHHAPEAFAVEAVDYLLKPFKRERLVQAIERARRRWQGTGQSWSDESSRKTAEELAAGSDSVPELLIPTRDGIIKLPQNEILWIEAEKDYVLIHTRVRTHILRSTMNDLFKKLADGIIRVHRSAFVALHTIHHTVRSPKGLLTLVLSDGAEIQVGPSYTREVRTALACIRVQSREIPGLND